MHTPICFCPRRSLILSTRSFFSPPAAQPSESAASSTFGRPPAYEPESRTVQMQAHHNKVTETTRSEVDSPSHIGNPDYGGKYGQQEVERYELVKE